jgi:hypothetical protein
MIRIAKAAAGGISTLAFVLGMSGAASAQSEMPPADPGSPPSQAADTANKAVQGAADTVREHMDREKVTLKDHVQQQIAAADSSIDALKRQSDADKGATKKRDEDLHKKLSDQRDRLKDDLDKIDKAQAVNDWKGVQAEVSRDLQAIDTSLKTAQNVTKTPRTGAANKQPGTSTPREEKREEKKPIQPPQ